MNDKTAPVFIAATANNVQQLPPELLRKGRFDEMFFVDLPTAEERAEIWNIHIELKGRKPADFDVAKLVQLTDGFTGAEIKEAVIAGLYSAFSDEQVKDLSTKHLVEEVEGTTPLSSTMVEQIKSVREWARTRTRPASLAVSDAEDKAAAGDSDWLASIDYVEDDDHELLT